MGCIVGCFVSAPFANWLGRRTSIVLYAALFCIASLIQFVAKGQAAVALMYTGRVLGGLAIGACTSVVPVYIAEVAPAEIRGRLVGIFEIGVQLGTTIGFWICYAVQQTMKSDTAQWRVPVALQLVPGGLLFIGMWFLPESIRWTAMRRGPVEARLRLSQVRNLAQDHPYVSWELQGIIDQIQFEAPSGPSNWLSTYRDCFSRSILPRLVTGMILMIFFQMSGTNAINYYSPRIYASLGFHGVSSQFLATGIYGVVRFVCTLIAMVLVVDRLGRRTMILFGSVSMGLCMWYIGAYLSIAHPEQHTGTGDRPSSAYSAIVFIYIYAACFCFSYAGVPWIYCSEIFPARLRVHCTSLTSATHWAFNLLIARATPYMLEGIGASTYFVFAACLTVAIPWAWFCMPETKGLTLEEMDELWGGPAQLESAHIDIEAQGETKLTPPPSPSGGHKHDKDQNIAICLRTATL